MKFFRITEQTVQGNIVRMVRGCDATMSAKRYARKFCLPAITAFAVSYDAVTHIFLFDGENCVLMGTNKPDTIPTTRTL